MYALGRTALRRKYFWAMEGFSQSFRRNTRDEERIREKNKPWVIHCCESVRMVHTYFRSFIISILVLLEYYIWSTRKVLEFRFYFKFSIIAIYFFIFLIGLIMIFVKIQLTNNSKSSLITFTHSIIDIIAFSYAYHRWN